MAELKGYITLGLVIFLLVCQVFVVIALMVLVKQYRSLKKSFEEHKASIHLQSIRRSTEVKEQSKNKYIEGKRSSDTLVRTNSEESVVWVPTPEPKRRAQEQSSAFDVTLTSYLAPLQGEKKTHTDNEIAVRACAEQVQENAGFEEEDAIYSNQEIVDMRRGIEYQGAESDFVDNNNTTCELFPQDSAITVESHVTSADHVAEDDGSRTEPIYENLRGGIDPRLLQA